MKYSLAKYSLVALLSLSACDYPSPNYPNPGTPEDLIDVSTETMSFSIAGSSAISRLSVMVQEDRPASADLKCSLSNLNCAKAKDILERNAVPVQVSTPVTNKVVLVYERVVARDCDSRYRDNMSGSRSRNHAAFGCSIASNMVQMVSDKNQFTNPALLDFPDAEKGNQSYSGYMMPSSERSVSEAEWTSSGTGN